MRNLLLALFLIAMMPVQAGLADFPPPPTTDAPPPPTPVTYPDWPSLVAALSLKGVDAAQVNWGPIEPMCLNFKQGADDTAYNQCRYDKAMLSHGFQVDHDTCKQHAGTVYAEQVPTRTYVTTDQNGAQHTVQEYATETLSGADLEALQKSTYDNCMLGLGWQNPDNWAEGKHAPAPSK